MILMFYVHDVFPARQAACGLLKNKKNSNMMVMLEPSFLISAAKIGF